MPRTRAQIQKTAVGLLGKLNGFEAIFSIVQVEPNKLLLVANDELTISEIYQFLGDVGNGLYKVPAQVNWKEARARYLTNAFTPEFKKAKRKKQ